jgi:DNA-binding transcriptional LysR family regulator
MNWDHLRSFLAAARSGTLSGASRALQVKHSTIGRHLSTLEETSRTKLFHRSPSGLALTPAGERLFKAAEAIEGEIQKAQSDIGGEDLAVSGKVRIAVPEGMGAILLAPALATLTAHHPALSIQLIAMPRLFNLTNREADITITLTLPQRGRLVSRRITDYALGLFASEDDARAGALVIAPPISGRTLRAATRTAPPLSTSVPFPVMRAPRRLAYRPCLLLALRSPVHAWLALPRDPASLAPR